MPTIVRPFEPADAPPVAALFAAYMAEALGGESVMTPERLAAGCGRYFELTLACDGPAVVGFAAWRESYDLHHAISGGEVMDFFVSPSHRGRGVAVQLVAGVAAAVKASGGAFLYSLVLPGDPARLKLARRWGVGFTGEHTYLAQEVFERIADWGGRAPAKAAIRELLALRPRSGRADEGERR